MEVVISSAGAISFWVAPVQMMVVHEGAIEQDSMMGTESTGNDVGGGGGASILRRPRAAFGIRLDHEPAEVRNSFINSVGGFSPPGGDIRIKRIKSLQASLGHRAATGPPRSPASLPTGERHLQCERVAEGNQRSGSADRR